MALPLSLGFDSHTLLYYFNLESSSQPDSTHLPKQTIFHTNCQTLSLLGSPHQPNHFGIWKVRCPAPTAHIIHPLSPVTRGGGVNASEFRVWKSHGPSWWREMTRGALRHQGTIISPNWEGMGPAEWGRQMEKLGTRTKRQLPDRGISTYYCPHSLHNDMQRICAGVQWSAQVYD
jgi:hypothetical protein